MAAQRNRPSGLGALLADSNLLPRILDQLPESDRSVVRLLSQDTRAAYDIQAQKLQARCHVDKDQIALQESSLRGLLSRGCRPETVILDIEQPQILTLQNHGLRLLRVFADVSRLAPLPTKKVYIDDGALAAEAAPGLVASAFPQLQNLKVCHAAGWAKGLDYALHKLLGTGGGDGAEEARQALLPRLEVLRLAKLDPTESDATPLPPALAASIRGATQLRGLRLDFMLTDAALEEPLAGLLTALTGLHFGFKGRLPADAGLPGLSRLVELTAANATLEAHALSRLACLTKLECGALCAPGPAGAVAVGPGAAAARTWGLPPQLAELRLASQPPEALPALRAARALTRWDVYFALKDGTHYDEGSALLPETEAALCRAAGVTRALGYADAYIVVTVDRGRLLPVGGQAEVGLGRRNHTPWLEAVKQAGVPGLVLEGVALSHQDMDTLSRCTALKDLVLPSSSFPPSALPKLGRLSNLVALGLDCNSWVAGPDGAAPVLELPPHTTGALLALCSDDRWSGRELAVTLYHHDDLSDGAKAQLASVVTSLQEELRRLGVAGATVQSQAHA